jgi:hypothetical protein
MLVMFGAGSFVIFWIVCALAGGDAVNGKIDDGRYYFGSHGKYTEVSRAAYVLSASYVTMMTATVSFFMLFVFCLMIKGALPIANKDFKKMGVSGLLVFIPLLIGCGFLGIAFRSLTCVLRAFGII